MRHALANGYARGEDWSEHPAKVAIMNSNKSRAGLRGRCVQIVTQAGLLIALVWILILLTMRHANQIAFAEAERESLVLTSVIAEQVSRSIRTIDNTLSFVAEDFTQPREPDRLRRLVESGGVRMDNLVLLSFVDGEGHLLQTNRGPSNPPIDLTDREHIRVHLDGKVSGLFVGKPVRGPASGQWSIQLTRAVMGSDGVPIGVIVGSLDPIYFESFWRNARLPGGMRIEVFGSDGALRASNGDIARELELKMTRAEIETTLGSGSAPSIRVPEGEHKDSRITLMKRIDGFPLVLRIEVDTSSPDGSLTALDTFYLLLGSMASCAILLLTWLLWRSTRLLVLKSEEAETARLQLRDAIEAVPEGFVLYDVEDRLAIMNESYRLLYARSSHSMRVGATFEEIIREGAKSGQYVGVEPNDVEDFVRQRMELHRNPSGPFEQQIDGGRWIRIEEKRTTAGGIVGFRSDITELKQRELALARQTALLSTTLEHMGEGLSVVDGEGRIVAYNSQFVTLLDIPQSAEIDGSLLKDVLAIFGQNGHVSSAQLIRDADEAFTISVAIPGKLVEWISNDGRVIELRSTALPDGGTVTLYNDVTEDREAELRIRASEALKSAMIATALDAIIITDEYGGILEFNAAAEQIFGWRASEVLGRVIGDIIVPERLRAQHKAGMKRYLQTREQKIIGQRLEVPAIDKLGREFPAELTVAAIAAGGRMRFSAYVRDISTRKQAEREALAAREAAEAASKAKTEFLAMVSHEFRTPMNGIVGLSGLLRTSELDVRQSQYLEGIEESARRLMVLTTDILDFSRIESGRLEIVPTTFDIHALLSLASETTRALAGSKPVVVNTELGRQVPRVVVGDANRLGQVLSNLLSNSAKFIERGSIVLRADAQPDASGNSAVLRIEVRDTGPGIPTDSQERLFTPFEQGRAAVAKQHGGSGLGLAICARLMSLMGGRIGFSSEEGVGSTFWLELSLPIGKAEDIAALADAAPLPPSGPSLNVLVAEDTPTSQFVARAMLEKLGHRVDIASDGAEALKFASELQFDLILMDLQMPVMGGIEATSRIRDLPGDAGKVPIISLSAQVLPAMRDESEAVGMAGHLSKPITLESLAAAIEPFRLGKARETTRPPIDDPVDEVLPTAEIIETLSALRRDLGDAAFDAVLVDFTSDCSTMLSQIADCIEAQDQDQLRRLGHKFNGLFGQFGCSRGSDLASQMETCEGPDDILTVSRQVIAIGREMLELISRYAISGEPCAGHKSNTAGR